MADNDSTSDKPGRQRKPGRPKSSEAYTCSIQLRLTEAQLQQLTERAREANCHRSDVLRAAMADGQLAMVRGPGQTATYRKLVLMDAALSEMLRLPGLSQAVRNGLQRLLNQVTELLATLSEPLL